MSIFGQKGHTIIVEWLISEQLCNPNDILEDLLEQDIIEMMRRKPLPNEWTTYFGSVTGRSAKPGQDVKKYNDLKASLPEGAIALIPSTRVRVRRQIVTDCEFMKEMKIMDYSLLIGVHHIPPTGTSAKKDRSCGTTGFRFSDGVRGYGWLMTLLLPWFQHFLPVSKLGLRYRQVISPLSASSTLTSSMLWIDQKW
jgi:Phosphatidylinositol-4-phosphate 5-Kinase